MPIVENGPKTELVQDFMIVFIICKFDEDPIENEVAFARTSFSPLFVYGRVKGK